MSFEHDPDLGKIELVTNHIGQLTILSMKRRLNSTVGIPAAIESIRNLGFGAQEEPYSITVITPRILVVLKRTLALSQFPVNITRYNYISPDCNALELTRRLNAFLQSSLPEFLEPIADEYFECKNQDPFKVAQQLFIAGLDAVIDVPFPQS